MNQPRPRPIGSWFASAVVIVGASSTSHAAPYSVGEQVTVASTAAGKLVIDRASATDDVTDAVSLRLDAIYTHAFVGGRGGLSNRGGDVLQALATVSWELDDHWSLGANAGFSPSSATSLTTAVNLVNPDGSTVAGNAELKSKTWSTSGELSAEYDTAGEGDISSVFGLAVGARLLESTQVVNRIVKADGSVATTAQLQQACAMSPCSPELESILTKQHSPLGQFQITGDVTETMWRKTDLDLSATYFLYSIDPLTSGVYALSTLGRSDAAAFGLPVVPLQMAVALAGTHRVGHVLSISGSGQYGSYVDAQGWNALLAAKARVRVSTDWQCTLALMVQRDAPVGAAAKLSRSLSLGASYTF